jgi:hypothetical protein
MTAAGFLRETIGLLYLGCSAAAAAIGLDALAGADWGMLRTVLHESSPQHHLQPLQER